MASSGPGPESPATAEAFLALAGRAAGLPRDELLAAAARLLEQGVPHGFLLDQALDQLAAEGLAQPRRSDSPRILSAYGGRLARAGHEELAAAVLDIARLLDPALAGAHLDRATLSYRAADLETARAAFLAARAAAPDDPATHAGLANVAARDGDAVAARAHAEAALALAPGLTTANLALARAELLADEFDAARQRLDRLLPTTTGAERIALLDLRAEVHLRAGSPALAFADWDARNRLIADGAALPPGLERASDRARRVADWLDGLDFLPTHPPAPSAPVLLVGFPRSGTTLLEKALAGHPAIRVLEEEPHLEGVAGPLLAPGSIARLPDLPETAVEPLRARYAAAAGLGREPILIDKMPLSTVLLPAIARLYPGSRILLALRDPRDVVLGVFRRRFRLNSAMVDMLELERAAAFYDSVMRIAMAAETRLPLRIHRVVHERLVADFDGELRGALAFLGLDWDDKVRDFAARATVRARTPSDLQLRKGLSAEGVGNWRAFRRELAPVLPKLNAWAERFGYPPD